MADQLIYPISTGRSGTVFLTTLLRENLNPDETVIFHERTGFPNFGVHTPDASHFTTFNNIGNSPNVSEFFTQKLKYDIGSTKPVYAEISHFLFKAGLIENLAAIEGEVERVDLIALKRDPLKTAWSFANRFDFFNAGFTWLFGLDPRYPNTIVDSAPFMNFGMFSVSVWYVQEVFARMEYYQMLIDETMPHVGYHCAELEEIVKPEGASDLLTALGFDRCPGDVKIPEKQNATKKMFFGDKEIELTKKTLAECWQDPLKLAREFYQSGKRLGIPSHLIG